MEPVTQIILKPSCCKGMRFQTEMENFEEEKKLILSQSSEEENAEDLNIIFRYRATCENVLLSLSRDLKYCLNCGDKLCQPCNGCANYSLILIERLHNDSSWLSINSHEFFAIPQEKHGKYEQQITCYINTKGPSNNELRFNFQGWPEVCAMSKMVEIFQQCCKKVIFPRLFDLCRRKIIFQSSDIDKFTAEEIPFPCMEAIRDLHFRLWTFTDSLNHRKGKNVHHLHCCTPTYHK